MLIKLGAAVIELSTSLTSLPLALPIKLSIKLSPSSSNSERTFFKAYFVLTFSGTISSSIFLAFLLFSFLTTSTFFLEATTGAGLAMTMVVATGAALAEGGGIGAWTYGVGGLVTSTTGTTALTGTGAGGFYST